MSPGIPLTTETTKNKVNGLDNHKDLRANQKLIGEAHLLHLSDVQKPTQRVVIQRENEETRKYVPKKQYKSPGSNLNETDKCFIQWSRVWGVCVFCVCIYTLEGIVLMD